MKSIPTELVNPLLTIIKQTILGYEVMASMNEEEILTYLAQNDEFVRQKFTEEKMEDIAQDLRVRELITGTKITIQTALADANKIKKWLEADDMLIPSVIPS